MSTSRLRPWQRVLIGLGLLILLVVGGLMVWWIKEPLAALAKMRRASLARSGFELHSLDTPNGPLVIFTKGSGPTLLMLHGVGDHAGSWSVVAPVLAERYRVTLVDLPGHGDSGPSTGPLPMATVIAGAERALAEAGPEPVIVIGNSLGGWLTYLLAEAHPERVERLVIVGGGPLAGEPGPALTPTTREEAAALMARVRDASAPELPGYLLDDLIERAGSGPIARLSSDVPGLVAALRPDQAVAALATPVDLLWGASDGLVPPSYAERLHRLLPRSRLTLLPACGHIPQVECPDAFLAALQELLSSQPPPAAPPAAAEANAVSPLETPVEGPADGEDTR